MHAHQRISQAQFMVDKQYLRETTSFLREPWLFFSTPIIGMIPSHMYRTSSTSTRNVRGLNIQKLGGLSFICRIRDHTYHILLRKSASNKGNNFLDNLNILLSRTPDSRVCTAGYS